jgi:hypothetical protein
MVDRFFCSGSLDSNTKGDLSRYTDYAALEQRVKELEIENNLLIKGLFESEELTTLRAENERLQARIEEQADEYGKLIQSLHADVADWHKTADLRSAEIVRLREVLTKVRALVEAIRSEHLTAKYILAEMRGHGYALYDQLEKKLKRTEAALAALEAEDD